MTGQGLLQSIRSPAASESLFSAWPEKSNQKRGHPVWRFPPIHGRKVRELGPGFSTAHPCAGEKESASSRFPLCGLSVPAHRRAGDPGRAACRPGAHAVKYAGLARDLVLPGVRAGARCFGRGPCAAVRAGRQARRVLGTMSRNPAGPHELSGHGCPESAKRGGISLGLLSFWSHKEKVTRPPQEGESLCPRSSGRQLCAIKALPAQRASGGRA